MGYDWKKPSAFPKGQTPTINQLLRNGSSRDYHFGPSLAGGATFEFIENIALRQDADLGPAKPALQQKFFTTAFIEQPAADKDFYCYDPLLEVFPAPTNIQEAANDILSVLRHGHPEMEKFHRIFVGGSDLTLAAWLMAKTEEIASNSTVVYPSTETIPIGQLKYAFSLEVKPAIDLKYTLVARLINPLVPELSATADDTSNFTLWLNGTASLSALGAQQGNTCIVTGRLAPTLGCRNKKQ